MRNTRQRREQIMHALVRDGSVQVTDLAERYGVSAVTIRTDLSRIASQGIATRTHGGASLTRTPPLERNIRERDSLNLALKTAIGAQAATLVNPGDNILIDSGSTTMMLARQLRSHADITVMTNGLNVAWELADAPRVKLLLTGGALQPQSLSLHGAQAEASLHNYSFDTVFLGVDGLDAQFGLTTHHDAEASLNQRMVECARRVVVLTDSSKLGKVSLHRIARLEDVDILITDEGIGADFRDTVKALGIEVIVVANPG